MELGAIAAFTFLEVTLILRLGLDSIGRGPLLAIAVTTGAVAMDLTSGVVHWAADTWGRPDWPVLGPLLIAPFREHHADPTAITRHDFVETNGASCLVALPAVAAATAVPLESANALAWLGVAIVTVMGAGAVLTNQIHQWAHAARVPAIPRMLMRAGLILSRERHAVHHRAPHTRAYCITLGWFDPLLDRVGVFPALERAIQATTAAVPRAAVERGEQRVAHLSLPDDAPGALSATR